MTKTFHIFANAALGKGLSGGDRIFIEFAKRLRQKNEVVIHVWDEGLEMCKRHGLTEGVKFERIDVDYWCKLGFSICYIARVIKSVWSSLFLKLDTPEKTVLYSASEFWMDSLPGLVLKLRYSDSKWVIGCFQVAPNPLRGFSDGDRKKSYRLSAFANWFVQVTTKPLIKRWADLVLVNNDFEKKYFAKLDEKGKVLVILGAVNSMEINRFLKENRLLKVYDAVFQGRFHPQKGVEELIDIWKLVTDKKPQAKLAMIGDGPLMSAVKDKVKILSLKKNIHLFGYIFDGNQKYKIFSQSKLVVHPAFFDSGGMAAAEAMAFGIPCVGFNLESYKSYYPRGMVKVELGNLQKFAGAILNILQNKRLREQIGKEGQEMINENWSWDQRVGQLLSKL